MTSHTENPKACQATGLSRLKRASSMAIKAALLASAFGVAPNLAHAEERLAIGATASTSAFYGYFVSIANIINDNVDGVSASVVETGATVDNLKRIKRGQLDLALVTTNTLSDAYEGRRQFEGNPVDSKILWVYFVAPQTTLVREDSGVKTFGDLEGKKFGAGGRGSSTEATTNGVLETFKIQPEYVKGGGPDLINATKDNQIVGMTSSSMGDSFSSTQIDLYTFGDMLPLSLSDDQVELVKEHHPQLTVVDMPAEMSEGSPAYRTWAFALATSASPNLSEETAYQIVKAVLENRQPQTDAMKATGNIDFAQATVDMATSPLHPGAIRYLREIGIVIPDRLVAEEDR